MKKNEYKASLGYLPVLDGLRALAIVLVMLAHANFRLFENGGIGVPIFFALSGFLITTLLIKEFEKYNKISFKAFYIRRTFRLFPALYFLLAAIFLYAFFFNPVRYPQIAPEIVVSGLYLYNMAWIWHIQPIMLYHTWSLGIEEQFYLTWPVVLYFFLRYNALRALSNLLIIFIAFFLITTTFGLINNQFFLILSAIFNESISIGCLIAILRWRGFLSFKIPIFLTFLCLIAILMMGIVTNKILGDFNQSLHKFAGILSAVIMLHLINNQQDVLHKIFANRYMVFIGKISYSLYLWHLPVFRIFAMHSPFPPLVSFACKFVVSFLLALLSWYVIEKKSNGFGHSLSKKILDKA